MAKLIWVSCNMSSFYPYYVHTLPGLEQVAWLEIRDRLPQAKFREHFFAKDQNGLVLFEYGGESADLLNLRLVEDSFLMLVAPDKLSRGREDLGLIREVIAQSGELGRVANVLTRYRRRPVTSYRVVVRKVGDHQYERKELEQVVLRAVQSQYPQWQALATTGEMEIWVNVLGSRLLMGVRLSVTTPAGTGLPTSVAAAMAWLSDPAGTDIFLDPLCQSPAILNERATIGPCQQLLAAEYPPRSGLKLPEWVVACRWTKEKVSLPAGSVTKIVTQLPTSNPAFYQRFLGEMGRLLRPEGRGVLLCEDYDQVREAVRQQPNLTILGGYSLAPAGKWLRIYLMKKVETP